MKIAPLKPAAFGSDTVVHGFERSNPSKTEMLLPSNAKPRHFHVTPLASIYNDFWENDNAAPASSKPKNP